MKKKILIVDDQESVLLVEERLAKFAGYDAVVASDGDEALTIARSQSIQLILLDIMMPGKTGFEVLKELRDDARTKDIPVVVITALDSERDATLRELSGIAGVLTKPVSANELKDTLRKILGPPTASPA